MTAWTILGMAGVVLILVAYGLLAAGKLAASSSRYQWINVVGTAGILFSLIGQWNLSAFITNGAWITIGIVSLIRHRGHRA